MKKTLIVVGIIALLGISWRLGAAVPAELDPAKVLSDTHKVLFENQFVRVFEFRVPPGKKEPWHQHDRRVIVFLSDFQARATEKGSQPKEGQIKAGSVIWSDPVIHQFENIGKTEAHGISVELK